MSYSLKQPVQAGFHCFAVCAVASAALLAAMPAQANLNSVMTNAFNADMNITAPSAYMGARRGAITFGKIRTTNRISNVNPVTFIPPGIKAGCGGIDIWGGSLSFASGRELEALAKNVMTGAAGAYAYQLALSNFPDGKEAMSTIRKMVADINKFNMNSCELTTKLLSGWKPYQDLVTANENRAATAKGAAKDDLAAREGSASKVSNSDLKDFRANPIYSALTEKGVPGWFPGGSTNFAHAIMSLTGAVVLHRDGEKMRPELFPATLTVDELVKGGKAPGGTDPTVVARGGPVELLTCGNAECSVISKQSVTIDNLEFLLYRTLMQSGGVIDKLASKTPLTSGEKSLLQGLSPALNHSMQALAADPGLAKEFAQPLILGTAYNLACRLAEDMVGAVKQTNKAGELIGGKQVQDLADDAQQKIWRSCDAAKEESDKLTDVIQKVAAPLIAATPKK